MEYSVTQLDNAKRVTFYGNLVPSARSKLLKIADEMTQSAEKEWILDIHEFTFIDSSGIGMLIELNQKAVNHGIRISLRGAQPAVKRLFELTHFKDLMAVED